MAARDFISMGVVGGAMRKAGRLKTMLQRKGKNLGAPREWWQGAGRVVARKVGRQRSAFPTLGRALALFVGRVLRAAG